MIIGIGNDICNMERIAAALNKFGQRFEDRIFTPAEQGKAQSRHLTAETYAKRWAAKEACAKALGTGVPRRGVHWKDMEVRNIFTGQPTLFLTGGAAARLAALTPQGMTAHIFLTMTDDPPWAVAHVLIEARPLDPTKPKDDAGKIVHI